MKRSLMAALAVLCMAANAPAQDPAAVTPTAVDFNAAVKNALDNSPDIRAIKNYIIRAKAEAMIMTGLNFDPWLGVSGGYDRQYDGAALYRDFRNYHAYLSVPLPFGASVGLTGDYQGYIYPSAAGGYDGAGLRLSYSQQLLKGLIGTPSLNSVSAAEYRVKAARELLRGAVLDKASELNRRLASLRLASMKAESDRQYVMLAGRIAQAGNAALAQAEEAARKAAAETSGAELENAREAFLAAAGYAVKDWPAIIPAAGGTTLTAQPPGVMSLDLEDTLAALQSAAVYDRIMIDIEKISMDAQSTEAFPELSLNFSMALNSSDTSNGAAEAFSSMIDASGKDYSVGLYFGTRIPNNYGRGLAGQAQAGLDAAKARYDSQLLNQRLRVRSAARELDAAIKRQVFTRDARAAFERRLSQAAGATELAIAQRDLHAARAEELNAQYELAVAAFTWDMINGKYEWVYSRMEQ